MTNEFVSVAELMENPPYGAQKAVREELFSMQQQVKSYMDTGLSQEEMTVAQSVRDAVNAANDILDKLFN